MDHELAADVVARMLGTVPRVVAEMATDKTGWLALFLADAHLLGGIIRQDWGPDDLDEIAGRLWMVAS